MCLWVSTLDPNKCDFGKTNKQTNKANTWGFMRMFTRHDQIRFTKMQIKYVRSVNWSTHDLWTQKNTHVSHCHTVSAWWFLKYEQEAVKTPDCWTRKPQTLTASRFLSAQLSILLSSCCVYNQKTANDVASLSPGDKQFKANNERQLNYIFVKYIWLVVLFTPDDFRI